MSAVDTLAGDGELAECESATGEVQQITVTFSEAMFDPAGDTDPADVSNPANFQLVSAGVDLTFSSTECGAILGDDELVSVDSVAYDDPSLTTTVQLASPLTDGLYRLLVCAEVQDVPGNPLDGDADGLGGDDFTRNFRADFGNLLKNGNFDCDLADWQATSTNPAEIVYESDDFQASPDSGSAGFTNLTASQSFTLDQCVEIAQPGVAHLLSGRYTLAVASTLDLVAGCTFFDAATCQSNSLGTLTGSVTLQQIAAGWPRFFAEVTPPATSVSASCSFELQTATGASFEANIDDLRLDVGVAPLFEDDFEFGNVDDWFLSFP